MCPNLDPFEAVEQRAVDLSWCAVFLEVDLQLRKGALAFADAGVAAEANLKAVNRDVAPAVSIAEPAADCIAILGPRVLKQVVSGADSVSATSSSLENSPWSACRAAAPAIAVESSATGRREDRVTLENNSR
jgi:hypothetical protein